VIILLAQVEDDFDPSRNWGFSSVNDVLGGFDAMTFNSEGASKYSYKI
jgi:hypothetical protein